MVVTFKVLFDIESEFLRDYPTQVELGMRMFLLLALEFLYQVVWEHYFFCSKYMITGISISCKKEREIVAESIH